VDKFLKFDVESVDVIEENPDSQFATARIQAFSSDKNLHDLYCSEETLKATASTIFNTPLLYSIDPYLDDFYTHIDASKSLICGFVVPDSSEFVRKDDGRLTLSVLAKIWKIYSPKVIELFKRDGGNKKISVEMQLHKTRSMDSVLTEMVSFAYTGICILGQYISEASPGANMQMVSFAEENKKYNDAYQKEFASLYKRIDMTIPTNVKETAKLSLEKHSASGGKVNSVIISLAKTLAKKDKITPEKIKQMIKFFSENVSGNELTFGLMGGRDAVVWSKKISDSIANIDSEVGSYIEETSVAFEKESGDGLQNKEEKEINMADKKEFEEKVTETPAEEKVETPAEEKEEGAEMAESETPEDEKEEGGKEEKFSLNAYLDVPAMLSYLQSETEDSEEMAGKLKMAVEEAEKGEFAKAEVVMSGMFAALQRMGGKLETMCNKMAEFESMCNKMAELEEFKASIESQQKETEVDKTLKEMAEKVVIPEEEMAEMKASAESFSLENLDVWKNECKAKSFDFAVKEKGEKSVVKIGMPFTSTQPRPSNDIWAGIK
jgi:hypothetical protein